MFKKSVDEEHVYVRDDRSEKCGGIVPRGGAGGSIRYLLLVQGVDAGKAPYLENRPIEGGGLLLCTRATAGPPFRDSKVRLSQRV